MPTIPVNDEGAVLYYEDSGAPNVNADYRTVFIVHGLIFHGATFRPTFPYAASHNLRLVTVNLREYPGSSRLNEREMANVWSKDPAEQATALREQAIELATFMARFIEAEDVPPPQLVDEKETGGASLLVWSQGNGHLVSLLSNISWLHEHTSALLERYLRTAIIYDPPCIVLGITSPPGVTTPLVDPAVPDDERAWRFVHWISSYFNPLKSPSEITMDALVGRYDMYEATGGDPAYLGTSRRMPQPALEAIVAPEILPRIGVALAFAPEVYSEAFRRAVFDTEGRWKRLRIVTLWPDMTIWTCSLSGKVMADMLAVPPREEEVRREVEMVWLEGANHAYHYDQPEKFMRMLVGYV